MGAGDGQALACVMATPRRPTPDELLASLPPELQTLAARGHLRHYRRGSLLIQEGDRGDTLYLIGSGRLRAFSAGDRDREITYGIYGPGDYVGEMSLDGGPRSASVETLEPSACWVITRSTLLAHIAAEPEFALVLMTKLIRRARAATLSARQMALEDVYGRLRGLLESLAGPPDAQGRRPLTERLTHQQMAHRLGCSREMVTRLWGSLLEGGYLLPQGEDSTMCLARALPSRW